MGHAPGSHTDPPQACSRARGAGARRWALAGAVVAIGLVASAVVGLPPLRASLRARVADALAARFPGAELSGDVRVDELLRVVAGPLTLPAGDGGAPALVTVERVKVRPRLRALLTGRVEIAAVAVDGVRVEAGARGERLADVARALATARRAGGGATPSAAPTLSFRRAFLHFGPPGATSPGTKVGPLAGTARLRRAGAESSAEVELRFPGDGEGAVHVRWGAGDTAVQAKLRDIDVAALPDAWRARLPLAGGSLHVEVDAPRLAGAGEARVRVVARGLELRDDRLAPEPVGPLELRVEGTARWDLRSGAGTLERGRVDLGASGRAGAPLRIAFASRPEPSFELEVSPISVDWEALASALPSGLAPPPEAPALRGALAGSLRVSGPVRRPEAWHIEGRVDPSGLEPTVERTGALDLAHPFTWRAALPDGSARQVVVGPRNPAFVALGSLPPHVVRAVLTSEDAGFYGHHGFDLAEIQDALARSGERRLRGASTITQQIAKNLFLSGERTYARKVREALTTVALEASLDKRRLLEIYLNMAEWGPNVFGIGEASQHWFGKDPRDLSPKEAAFLATVIPNPVRYEMYRRRGALTDRWEERVRDLLVKLRAADVIDDEQLRQAWDAPLAFARGA